MKHVDATASIELLAESRRAAEERVAKLRAEKEGLVQQSRDVEHLGYRKLQSKDVEAIEAKMARARAACEKHEGRHAAAATALLHARAGLRGLCRAAAAAGVKETSLHDPRGRTAIAAYRRWAVSDPIAEAAAARAEAEKRSEVAASAAAGGRRGGRRGSCWRRRPGRGRRGVGGGGGGERGGERGGGGGGGGRGGGGGGEAQAAAPRRPATAGASGGGGAEADDDDGDDDEAGGRGGDDGYSEFEVTLGFLEVVLASASTTLSARRSPAARTPPPSRQGEGGGAPAAAGLAGAHSMPVLGGALNMRVGPRPTAAATTTMSVDSPRTPGGRAMGAPKRTPAARRQRLVDRAAASPGGPPRRVPATK